LRLRFRGPESKCRHRLLPSNKPTGLSTTPLGEVYRARDTKLGREVAVKVLPDDFASDVKRRARFEREARLLASLNHPGIATLHGIEEVNGTHFLVMEMIEGETLAKRIERGPIPVREAMALFVQIAEALEAAHDRGVLHRDLKPPNVMLTKEGHIKVLDFGLAKSFGDDDEIPSESSQSPTLTKDTALGTILGTASYMSPEQARGKTVDKRTDVWAFGCCLYEALTARKAFEGETVTDTLAAVVKSEPDWAVLPPEMASVLRRCLNKSLRNRRKDIGDVRLDLEETSAIPGHAPPKRHALPWLVAALTAALVIALVVTRPAPEEPKLQKFQVLLPENRLASLFNAPQVSPDGDRLVFVGRDESGTFHLWVRDFDALEPLHVAGTEGASFPFWAPDSERVGFFADGMLRTTDMGGAPPRTLAEVGNFPRGGTWNDDDAILFAAGNDSGILRVSQEGEVDVVTELDATKEEDTHRWPHFLPDGTHFLFTARSLLGEHSVKLASLDSTPRLA